MNIKGKKNQSSKIAIQFSRNTSSRTIFNLFNSL